MKDEILSISSKDIICFFEVEEKEYCAFVDSEEDEDNNVYFGLITEIEENHKVITSVSEQIIDKVIEAYEKYLDFFESEDELDIEEGELDYYE